MVPDTEVPHSPGGQWRVWRNDRDTQGEDGGFYVREGPSRRLSSKGVKKEPVTSKVSDVDKRDTISEGLNVEEVSRSEKRSESEVTELFSDLRTSDREP